MIWQRIRNLWRLSGEARILMPNEPIPKDHMFAHIITPTRATIIPYQKVDPIKKITEETNDN